MNGIDDGAPPGWYPDPIGGGGQRYWDGRGWTDKVTARDAVGAGAGAGTAAPRRIGPLRAWAWLALGLTLIVAIAGAVVLARVGSDGGRPGPYGPCHPNYEPCVPVDTDVDCRGEGGDGPAHVDGPVRVRGADVYGLDEPDDDGIGCE